MWQRGEKKKNNVFFPPFILEVGSGVWERDSSLEEFTLQLAPLA